MGGNNTFTQQFFLSFTGSFQTLILRLRKHVPCIHNAEEKESMTMVRSKVTSEHGNLANRGFFNSKAIAGFIQKS